LDHQDAINGSFRNLKLHASLPPRSGRLTPSRIRHNCCGTSLSRIMNIRKPWLEEETLQAMSLREFTGSGSKILVCGRDSSGSYPL